MWRWNREFQRREGRRYPGVLPGDEAERRGSRSAEQRTRVAKITANPSRGAAHAGRSTYPRAAYSGRTFAEGQAADCAQLERPAAAAFQRRGGGDGISGGVAALDHRRGGIVNRRTACRREIGRASCRERV